MIWFSMAVVVGIAVGLMTFILSRKDGDNWRTTFEMSSVMMVGAFLIGAVVAVVMNVVSSFFLPTHYEYKEYVLQSLQDGKDASGSFFLGTGYVDSYPSFTYYLEENGRYRLKSTNADFASVTYTSGTPKMVERWKVDDQTIWCMWTNKTLKDVEFQVPPGSVYKDYSLDAN